MEKKYNVSCMYCGTKEFNPKIPKDFVIDTCSRESCMCKSENSILGFLNGDSKSNLAENIFEVHPTQVTALPVDYDNLSVSEKEKIETTALLNHYLLNEEYGQVKKILKSGCLEGTPENDYYWSKLFFKKHNNNSVGLKLLKEASKAGQPLAQAEYGFIIAKGLYGQPRHLKDGLDNIVASIESGDYFGGIYLADIYYDFLVQGVRYYEGLEDTSLFSILYQTAIRTSHPQVSMVLGYMYWKGIGTFQDIDRAFEYLSYAADHEDVMACEHLVDMIYEDNPKSLVVVKEEAEFYLSKTQYKNTKGYRRIQKIYDEVFGQ